jgi:ABC-type uncharacterized transport system ATPase subunit
MQVLAGQREPRQGELRIHGELYGRTRMEMSAPKVFCLPEEPLRNACVAPMNVAENLAFRIFDQPSFAAGGWWILELSDRVFVMFEGRLVYETAIGEADLGTIGARMAGH